MGRNVFLKTLKRLKAFFKLSDIKLSFHVLSVTSVTSNKPDDSMADSNYENESQTSKFFKNPQKKWDLLGDFFDNL